MNTREMEVKRTVLDLLEKIAEEQKYVDYTAAIERVSDDVNIMSECFRATLNTPGKPDLTLFVKVASMSDKVRKAAAFNPYEFESYFYKKIQKQFEKLEQKYGIPEDQRIRTPKLYGLRDDFMSETLVLEDLAVQGFQNFNTEKSADMEYMYAGIDLMAKFHALSMTYNRDDPDGFRQTSESLVFNMEIIEEFLMSTKPKILTSAFTAAGPEHKVRLVKYFETSQSFQQITLNYRCYNRNILVHGDFKPSNLMHRRRNGKLELAILDFQMVHDGDPVAELLYFIFTATDEQFRRVHYHELMDLYYERLRAALHNLRLEPEKAYPEKVYRTQLEECSRLGLAMSALVLPVILVEKNKAPGFDGEDANMADIIVEGSALFKERFNGVINNFVEWGLI